MSLYDRGYYQDSYSGQGRSGPQSVVTTLILINVAVFILDAFSPGGRWLSEHMALNANLLFSKPWYAWQLITAGFAHSPLSQGFIWHILGNMVGLYVFGRTLESSLGRGEFLRLYLTLIALPFLLWAILEHLTGSGNTSIIGASGAVAGLVVIYAIRFPHNKLMLIPIPAPIPAWALGLLLVLSNLYSAIMAPTDGSGPNIAFTAHLAGAACGALYQFSGIYLGNVFPFTMQFKLPKRSTRLRVHRPDDNLAERADQILRKLHAEGEQSITAKERKILNEYSKRVRGRQ